MKAQKANIYLGLGFLVFGVVTWIVAGYEATGYTYRSISPAFFPRLLAGLISLLGIILFIQSRRKGKLVEKDEGVFTIESSVFRRIILITLISFFYVFVMQYIGYILSTFLFLFFVMKYFYKVALRTNLIISIALPIILNVAFRFGMNVVVPVGSIIEMIIY